MELLSLAEIVLRLFATALIVKRSAGARSALTPLLPVIHCNLIVATQSNTLSLPTPGMRSLRTSAVIAGPPFGEKQLECQYVLRSCIPFYKDDEILTFFKGIKVLKVGNHLFKE